MSLHTVNGQASYRPQSGDGVFGQASASDARESDRFARRPDRRRRAELVGSAKVRRRLIMADCRLKGRSNHQTAIVPHTRGRRRRAVLTGYGGRHVGMGGFRHRMSVKFRVGVGVGPLPREVAVERKTLCVMMVD